MKPPARLFARDHTRVLHAACLLLLLLTVPRVLVSLAYQFALDGGSFNVDSPIFWTVGRGLADGLQPYRDLYEVKPPGIFFVSALSYWLTGDLRLGHVLYASAVLLPAALMTLYAAHLFRRHSPAQRLLYVGLALVFTGLLSLTTAHLSLGFIVEPFGLLFIVLYGLLLGLRPESPRGLWLAGAGLTLFAAVGFKEPFVLSALAVAVLHARRPRELISTFAIPCLLAALAGVAVMAALGYLGDYVNVYLPHMLGSHIQRGGVSLWERGLSLIRLFVHFDELPGALSSMKWTIPLLVGDFLLSGLWRSRPRIALLGTCLVAMFVLVWTFRARDATANLAIEVAVVLACIGLYALLRGWLAGPRRAVLLAILPALALLVLCYLGVNSGTVDTKIWLAWAYVGCAAGAVIALLWLPLDSEERRPGLLILAIFSLALLYATQESAGLILYMLAPMTVRGRIGVWLAIALACLILGLERRIEFDSLWRVGRLLVAGYLLALAFGLGGVYAGVHLLFAMTGLFALFQLFLERQSKEPDLAIPSLGFILILLGLLATIAFRIDWKQFLQYQETLRERTQPAVEIAAQVDAILENCGKSRYLYLGHSGPPVFAFTRHSPLGPYFYQSPVLIGNQSQRFYESMRRNLNEADLIVMVDLSLKAMNEEAARILARDFGRAPWQCAGRIEAVDTRNLGIDYTLLFRNGGDNPGASPL